MMKKGSIAANGITCIRILCALSLIFCPAFSVWFYVLYMTAGISDVLDGMAARKFGAATKLGAQLDTIADVAFWAVVIVKTVLAVSVPLWLMIWAGCIALIKCFSIIMGFVICKRFVSEHTAMNKICGLLLFAIPLCIGHFPRLAVAVLVILTCGTATLAAVQEAYYIRIGKIVS